MCFDCEAFNSFLIHEDLRFNIEQRVEKYEKKGNEGYQRLVFDPEGLIQLHMIKEKFLIQRCSMLRARVDGPSKIIKKIGKNAYKLELPDDNNILHTFNVKDLMPYHGEDWRSSLFLLRIDAGASTTNNENSIFILENLNSGCFETLETPNIFLYPSILSLVSILIWSFFMIAIFVL